MKNIKKAAYRFCESFIEERSLRLNKNLDSIKQSLSTETKSSAGDKHETARAMLHLEREKLSRQLAEIEKTKRLLSKTNLESDFDKVRLGSLVITSRANYFLAISAGEFKSAEISVFCISPGTPMGKALLGKSTGDVVHFNSERLRIQKIV